jgi:DNA invertase Pin-like site-specific DNA recombinase
MNPKITPEHLARAAVVYVRQSTMNQVAEHTESQRRQYALEQNARAMGFVDVKIIDDDLGRSGSGLVERPGFQRLVASVCSGDIGAVFCIEASRLARNGRDWHHLIDLCALVGTLVIDPDGVYEPRHSNDRLLLGLKGTMSEYELSLLRQRGIAARDSKAQRGELRFGLPPGYVWNELGKIEIDPDERVADAIALVFRKFRELGSVRQVMLWAREHQVQVPVMQQGPRGPEVAWRTPQYHNVLGILQHAIYTGAYVFGRKGSRTMIVDGRARKSSGHRKPIEKWNVLIRDHHPSYVSWDEFQQNQTMISENAHMKKRAARKSGRGGRALLTGLLRCGRCGRMLRIFYGSRSGQAHRYLCRGDEMRIADKCIGIGGVKFDRAVAEEIVRALEPYAIEAAIEAERCSTTEKNDQLAAYQRELEEAQYEVRIAARRHAAVDPDKRLVARELEARWESALQRAREIETRIDDLRAALASSPPIDRESLLALAADLPTVWNSPKADHRTKQRIVRALIREVVVDVDETHNLAIGVIHWAGGRHTPIRIKRRKSPYPTDLAPTAVDALRKLGGRWPDRDLAVTLNRMRCKTPDGGTWTVVRVRELRERLSIDEYDPLKNPRTTISVDEAAIRLSICVGSVHKLIRDGALPASQALPCAPWEIPIAALQTEAVQIGVREIIARRPRNLRKLREEKTLRLPGF